jgi:hypothetical protein
VSLSSRSGVFALPPFTIRSALNGAVHVRERLAHAGIRLPPRHRLQRAEETIRELLASNAVRRDRAVQVSRTQLGEMLRTILEQFFIVRALASDPSVVTPELQHRLKAILSGGDAPGDDRRTAARDVQFELVIAALLRLAGVRGVHWAEPDLRIPAGDQDLCLAVKRISSTRQFERRVKGAIKQIRRQKGMGLIVLGLDAFTGGPAMEGRQGSEHATRRARARSSDPPQARTLSPACSGCRAPSSGQTPTAESCSAFRSRPTSSSSHRPRRLALKTLPSCSGEST